MQFGGGSSSTALSSPPFEAPQLSSPESQGAPPAKKDYDECRIQVLLQNSGPSHYFFHITSQCAKTALRSQLLICTIIILNMYRLHFTR